ncbi:MAG: 3-deoxy-manno-octulosonate cytidylyltransferase [Candidatus Aminicenantes bacterium]|nr:3-deoxy-manno-octulosonate cytidylyltransferase [Candidatus Aminicenantes bacterium]
MKKTMKIAAIIPARYHSTRFIGKPLALIAGKPMIERVYCQAARCEKFSEVIVATDDRRIADVVERFGGHAVMTSPHHGSGTERLWEVLENRDFDAAVNIQGDEPIISENLLRDLVDRLETGRHEVVTAYHYNNSYEDYLSRHVVKVVMDANSRALYFSRSPIPFAEEKDFPGFFHHIGLYGYLKRAVEAFIKLPKAPLEKTEKLEQLRFLENGIAIDVMQSRYRGLGVDVPGDVQRIEKMLLEEEEIKKHE